MQREALSTYYLLPLLILHAIKEFVFYVSKRVACLGSPFKNSKLRNTLGKLDSFYFQLVDPHVNCLVICFFFLGGATVICMRSKTSRYQIRDALLSKKMRFQFNANWYLIGGFLINMFSFTGRVRTKF